MNKFSDKISSPYKTFYIPRDQIWIDKPFAPEKDFLLQIENFYDDPSNLKTIKEFFKRGGREDEKRGYIKKLCSKGSVPEFIRRTEGSGETEVCYVDGSIVRSHLDPEFSYGGHDLVYSYIPKGQIWLDILMEERELAFILIHEKVERDLMKNEAKSYSLAHDFALVYEKEARIKAGYGMYPNHIDTYKWRNRGNDAIIKEYHVE